MRKEPLKAWDLFCGGSLAGTAIARSFDRIGFSADILGVNHNQRAIQTSQANHPEHRYIQSDIQDTSPLRLMNGRAFFGWASPSCVFHSSARGGRPIHDQERSSAWDVCRWMHQTKPQTVICENVPEFELWGPLKPKVRGGKLVFMRTFMKKGKVIRKETTDVPFYAEDVMVLGFNGQPQPLTREQWLYRLSVHHGLELCLVKDPDHAGEEFLRWVSAICALGYVASWRVLVCADYGDPTTRRRLFIQFQLRETGRQIYWPNKTHCKPDAQGRVPEGMRPWVPARAILDFSDLGQPISERKRPLAPKTLRRIVIGLKKFLLEPFILPQQSHGDRVRSSDNPLQTLTTESRGVGVCQPYIVPNFGERPGQEPRTHSVDNPTPTVTSHGAGALASAFIIPQQSNPTPKGVDAPVGALVSDGSGPKLTTAFILPQQRGGAQVKPLSAPVSPLTTRGAEALAIVKLHGTSTVENLDAPVSSITAGGQHHAIMATNLVKFYGTGTAVSADGPVDSLTSKQRFGLMNTFISAIDNQSTPDATTSAEMPVSAITTKQRHAVVNTCLVSTAHGDSGGENGRVKSTDVPLGTIVGSHDQAVTSFVAQEVPKKKTRKAKKGDRVQSVDEPLKTVAGNRGDQAIVTFEIPGWDGKQGRLILNCLAPGGKGRPILEVGDQRYEIEVYFRMLKVLELAAAHSLPLNYSFVGTKTDAVKMIGNGVPGKTAEALTLAAILQTEDISHYLHAHQ